MKEIILASLKVDERYIERSCALVLRRVEEISDRLHIAFAVAFYTKYDRKLYNVLVSSDKELCRKRFVSAAKTLIEEGKEGLLKEIKMDDIHGEIFGFPLFFSNL